MSALVPGDFTTLPAQDRYKLLCALVVPRPIALVTTLGPGGIVNAAPFSFFNVFAEDPPLVVLGLQSRPDGSLKDTSAHIRDTSSFTVNLVDEALAERMNICAVDFPPGHQRDRCRRSDGGCRALRSRCRGSRRRRLRWSAATIRRWRSARAPPVRRRGRLPARAGRHCRSRTHVREPRCLPAGGAPVRQSLRAARQAVHAGAADLRRVARVERNQARLNCTAPSAIVTAACVGSITGMPSASSSGRR